MERHNGLLGSQYVVHASDGSVTGCRFDELRILTGFACNGVHNVDKLVKRCLALALCRLYHHGLMEQQREVNGGGVETIVEQALGYIHRGYARRLVS